MRNENQKEIMKILNEVSETLKATSNTLCYNKIEDVKKLFKLEFEQKSSSIKNKKAYYYSQITKCFTEIQISHEIKTNNYNGIAFVSTNGVVYKKDELYLSPILTDKFN